MRYEKETNSLLPFLGMGFYWAWIALVFYSDTLFGGFSKADELVDSFWLWATWSHTFALAMHIALSRRLPRLSQIPALGAASAACMAAGCAVPTAFFLVDETAFAVSPLLIGAAIIVGVSSCWHVLLWGESFAHARQSSTVTLGVLAILAGLLLYLASYLVPSPIRAATTIALPVLSLFCMREAAKLGSNEQQSPNALTPPHGNNREKPRKAAPTQPCAQGHSRENERASLSARGAVRGWSMLIASLFILALGGEILRVFSMKLSLDTVNQTGLLYFAGGACGLLAQAAWLKSASTRKQTEAVTRPVIWVVLILMSIAFLAAPFLSGYSFAICYGVFGAGFWCFRALSWSFAVLSIQKLHVPPTRAVGILDASFGLAVVVSGQVSFFIAESILGGTAEISTVSLIVVFALMLLSILILNERKAALLLDTVFSTSNSTEPFYDLQLAARNLVQDETSELANEDAAGKTADGANSDIEGPSIERGRSAEGKKPTNETGENNARGSKAATSEVAHDATQRVQTASSEALEDSISQALASQYRLTPRECEVAALLAKGRSLPFVQKELFISAGTAQTHVRHIYKKMNVHTRQEFLDAFEKVSRNA